MNRRDVPRTSHPRGGTRNVFGVTSRRTCAARPYETGRHKKLFYHYGSGGPTRVENCLTNLSTERLPVFGIFGFGSAADSGVVPASESLAVKFAVFGEFAFVVFVARLFAESAFGIGDILFIHDRSLVARLFGSDDFRAPLGKKARLVQFVFLIVIDSCFFTHDGLEGNFGAE